MVYFGKKVPKFFAYAAGDRAAARRSEHGSPTVSRLKKHFYRWGGSGFKKLI